MGEGNGFLPQSSETVSDSFLAQTSMILWTLDTYMKVVVNELQIHCVFPLIVFLVFILAF